VRRFTVRELGILPLMPPWSDEYLTSHKTLAKLTGVGRHVSSGRRRSLRGRLFLALLAIIVLICVAAFAAYRIWDRSRESPAAPHRPRTRVTTSATPSPTTTPVDAVTLALTVTGPSCQVFVRVPGGDILVNRSLVRGQSVRLDEQRLSIVLGDASAVRVYVNGKLRPPGKPGRRVTFTALKG
jgi:hypothetical protein